MTKVATVARLDGARARAGFKKARLLEEHPTQPGEAYKLIIEITRNFFVGRVRSGPGGALIDKLLIDETDTVTQDMVERTIAVDLVMSNNAVVRYATDGGFMTPVGRTRRFVGTIRVNKSDETPINV